MNKKGLNIKWYELIVAKVYKYFRLVKISFQLRFSINTLPRTAQDIARLPKEVPGMFFEADIFKLSDIAKLTILNITRGAFIHRAIFHLRVDKEIARLRSEIRNSK